MTQIFQKHTLNKSERMQRIKIYTTIKTFDFIGIYRRDLETKNWHYYEDEKGHFLHINKQFFVAVESKTMEET